MKCLYIGDFQKDYSTENYVAFALEENGVTVIKVQENAVDSLLYLDQYIDMKPNFVLFCKNRTRFDSNKVMQYFKDLKIKTVTWVFDLYFDLPIERSHRSSFDSNFKADVVFSTDGGHDKNFKEQGINHKLLRQGIHVLDAHYGEELYDVAPIVFIGSVVYADRRRLINFLKETYGNKFCHYGMGSQTDAEIRGKELNNILANAKIVVGDSQPSKQYWSNRLYEITGRGGLLMHPEVEGLEKEFEYYKEIIPYTWGDLDQVKEIIDHYLSHPKEADKIRKAGYERTKKNYTYTHRVKELLKNI